MNIENVTFSLTRNMILAHKKRDILLLQGTAHDPYALILRLYNTELDTLHVIDPKQSMAGWNHAFNEYY